MSASPSWPTPRAPVGWRVRDYMDGWLYFATAAEALAEVQRKQGALLEPVFHPPVEAPGGQEDQ